MWKGFNWENLANRRGFRWISYRSQKQQEWHRLTLTPDPHKHGKEHGCLIIKQMGLLEERIWKSIGSSDKHKRSHAGNKQGNVLVTQYVAVWLNVVNLKHFSLCNNSWPFFTDYINCIDLNKLIQCNICVNEIIITRPANIWNRIITQDERHVESSLQKVQFLSQRGHIMILPPILGSHISLLKIKQNKETHRWTYSTHNRRQLNNIQSVCI